MSIDYLSFAAHVDYTQNSTFIDQVKPAHLVSIEETANSGTPLIDISLLGSRSW